MVSGSAEGTIRKNSIFTETAVIYHILPSWIHWLLYQSISGEILINFSVITIFLAQKLAKLETFNNWPHHQCICNDIYFQYFIICILTAITWKSSILEFPLNSCWLIYVAVRSLLLLLVYCQLGPSSSSSGPLFQLIQPPPLNPPHPQPPGGVYFCTSANGHSW